MDVLYRPRDIWNDATTNLTEEQFVVLKFNN